MFWLIGRLRLGKGEWAGVGGVDRRLSSKLLFVLVFLDIFILVGG